MVLIEKEDDGVSTMYNEKLVQIGSKLNVSEQEIKDVQSQHRQDKILSPIKGGIIAILSTTVGFVIGASTAGCYNCDGYPYAIGGFAPVAQQSRIKKYLVPSVIVTAAVSLVGFLIAYSAAQTMFGYAIDYNVYSKK